MISTILCVFADFHRAWKYMYQTSAQDRPCASVAYNRLSPFFLIQLPWTACHATMLLPSTNVMKHLVLPMRLVKLSTEPRGSVENHYANIILVMYTPLLYIVCKTRAYRLYIFFSFLYPDTFKKCGGLCYTLRQKIAFECPSVRLSVRLSVSTSFSISTGHIFLPIFLKLGIRVDIEKECLGIADEQISTNMNRVALDLR